VAVKVIRTRDAKITLRLATLESILDPKKVVTRAVADELGKKTKKEVLDLVAVGKSPVKGEGRFEAYAAQRGAPKPKRRPPKKAKPTSRRSRRLSKLLKRLKKLLGRDTPRKKRQQVERRLSGRYPEIKSLLEKFPNKKTRPVNLKLDGTYLDEITQHELRDGGIDFGLLGDDIFMQILFNVHNEGERSDIPQRKVIPTGEDTFVPSILRVIKKVYLKRIRNIINSRGR
jgi:hypothetical protein